MTGPVDKPKTHVTLVQLIPNMLTVTAVCLGITAIRFGVQGNHTLAVQLIIAACVLDGLDGRIARLMRADSQIGAELDSLADFLNFGVAPALVIYFWTLQDLRGLGWISVLLFSVCCLLRLARFNVANKAIDKPAGPSLYFTGIPSPAGALLALWPMFVSLAFSDRQVISDLVVCANLVLVGLAMISRIPVWSFKTTRVSRENAKFVLVAVAFVGAALTIYPWITMSLLLLIYIALVGWNARRKNSWK